MSELLSKNIITYDDEYEQTKPLSLVLVMVCIYLFLVIERPWESISYLNGIPIERSYAIAMILVAFLKNKFRTVNSPTNKWVYGLLLLHFLFAPFAFDPASAVEQGFEYAKVVVIYLLMLVVADDEASLKMLVKVFVFSMMFYVLHSLWEYHNGRHFYRMGIHRMIGVDSKSGDPNSFGASVVFCLPFVYALLRSETNKLFRWSYYVYFLMAVHCVVLTGSRSASIALVLLLVFWASMQHGKRKIIIFTVVLISMGTVWHYMPEEKRDRIRTLWDKDAGPSSAYESADGRRLGLRAGWLMFKDHPFTGVGAGAKNFIGYRITHKFDEDVGQMSLEAHNLYGEVLGEFGLSGAFCLFGLIVSIMNCCSSVFKRTFQSGLLADFKYSLSWAIISCLLLLLLLGLSGHNFYRPLWLWIAAWAGTLARLVNQESIILQQDEFKLKETS